MNIVSEGSYKDASATGLITTIAAGTASAGHVWAARWAPPTNDPRKFAVIKRLRAFWYTIAGFTAAQEVSLQLFKATAFSALHTAGTAIAGSKKQRTSLMPAPLLTGQIATTTALTNGTETLDTGPIAQAVFSELAAGATVPKGVFTLNFQPDDTQGGPFALETNEGLVLRNGVLMGAGGTARVVVELDWEERTRYPDQFTARRAV